MWNTPVIPGRVRALRYDSQLELLTRIYIDWRNDQLKDQQRILNIMTKAHIYNSRPINGFLLPMRWSILCMIIQVQPRKVTLSLDQCHHPFLTCRPSVLPSRYLFSFAISPSYMLKVFLAFSIIWLDYDLLLQSGRYQ